MNIGSRYRGSHNFQDSLGYIIRSCVHKKQTNKLEEENRKKKRQRG